MAATDAVEVWKRVPRGILLHIAGILGARFLASAAGFMISPYLVVRFTSELNLSPLHAVVLASFVLVGGRLFAKPVGILADKWQGLWPAVGSLTLAAVSTWQLHFIMTRFGVEFATVACVGLSLSGASLTIFIRAHLARAFPRQQLTVIYSASSVSFNLGMFFGAAASGWMLRGGTANALIPLSAALYVLSSALIAVLACATKPQATRGRSPQAAEGDSASRAQPRQESEVRREIVSLGPFRLSYAITGYLTTSVTLCLAVYCERVFGAISLASVFFSSQSIALVVLLPLVGASIRKLATVSLALMYFLGVLTITAAVLIFGMMPARLSMAAIAVLSVGFCMSQALSIPTADPLLSRIFGGHGIGRVFGSTTSAAAIGSVVACFSNAVALDVLSADRLDMMWVCPGAVGLFLSVRLMWKNLSTVVGPNPRQGSSLSARKLVD
jgi:hypothetical protein